MSAGHMLMLATLLLGSLCISASQEASQRYSKLRRFVRHAPLVSYYNYIVVGGGTAGCPLAATPSKRARR